MKETIALSLFAAGLIVCLCTGSPVLLALIFGYLLFAGYALSRRFSIKEILLMSWQGVRTVRNVLIVFIFIGMITAVWRGGGTIPLIVYAASELIVPALFVPLTFGLNCLLSFLAGTAFGTAATMGVICMSIGQIMGIDTVMLGGVILSGCFFGDRCSPISTSALLVSELTKTDIYRNIKNMVRTALVPFLLTCVFFICLGLFSHHQEGSLGILELLPRNFSLHWLTLLPAILVLVLALFRLNVKWIMSASIACAIVLCLTLQHMSLSELLTSLVMGYHSPDPRLAVFMDGGGIISMLNAAAIICLSSCYAGIFEKTGLLNRLKGWISTLSAKIGTFGSTMLTALATGAIACNQVLSIMLVHQLCKDTIPDEYEMALTMENTSVIMAPLIPWSIASGVPLAAIGAPDGSILFAGYLYILPLWCFGVSLYKRRKQRKQLKPNAKNG